jgi:hypothetical protein
MVSFSLLVASFGLSALAQQLPANPVPVPDGPKPKPVLLAEARELLKPDYPKDEAGYLQLPDSLYYISSSLYD